jgi:hypothetical protein
MHNNSCLPLYLAPLRMISRLYRVSFILWPERIANPVPNGHAVTFLLYMYNGVGHWIPKLGEGAEPYSHQGRDRSGAQCLTVSPRWHARNPTKLRVPYKRTRRDDAYTTSLYNRDWHRISPWNLALKVALELSCTEYQVHRLWIVQKQCQASSNPGKTVKYDPNWDAQTFKG